MENILDAPLPALTRRFWYGTVAVSLAESMRAKALSMFRAMRSASISMAGNVHKSENTKMQAAIFSLILCTVSTSSCHSSFKTSWSLRTQIKQFHTPSLGSHQACAERSIAVTSVFIVTPNAWVSLFTEPGICTTMNTIGTMVRRAYSLFVCGDMFTFSGLLRGSSLCGWIRGTASSDFRVLWIKLLFAVLLLLMLMLMLTGGSLLLLSLLW